MKISIFRFDLGRFPFIVHLRKACQNTGFLLPVYSRIRTEPSIIFLIQKYAGHKKPAFWYILRSGRQSFVLSKQFYLGAKKGTDIRKVAQFGTICTI